MGFIEESYLVIRHGGNFMLSRRDIMATEKFGNPKAISSPGGAFLSSLVPMEILRNIRPRVPYKVTISGSSNIVFTLLGSTTHTVPIWNGVDYGELKESLAYTWQAGSLNTILNSSGVVTTLQATPVGVWYMYVGFIAGVPTLYPSQTGPSEVQGPYEGGPLCHPGTSRVRSYAYVGFTIATATTPAFLTMVKTGKWYGFADQTVANATTGWAERAFTAMPKLGALGGELKGYVGLDGGSSLTVGSTSTAAQGVYKFAADAVCTNGDSFQPLPPIPMSANGRLYSVEVGNGTDLYINGCKDVV